MSACIQSSRQALYINASRISINTIMHAELQTLVADLGIYKGGF